MKNILASILLFSCCALFIVPTANAGGGAEGDIALGGAAPSCTNFTEDNKGTQCKFLTAEQSCSLTKAKSIAYHWQGSSDWTYRTDKCETSNSVREYTCQSGYKRNGVISCGFGQSCEAGRCVYANQRDANDGTKIPSRATFGTVNYEDFTYGSCVNVSLTSENQVVTGDGWNATVQGKIRYTNLRTGSGPSWRTDTCEDAQTLREYDCDASGYKRNRVVTCPNGCQNGACRLEACGTRDNDWSEKTVRRGGLVAGYVSTGDLTPIGDVAVRVCEGSVGTVNCSETTTINSGEGAGSYRYGTNPQGNTYHLSVKKTGYFFVSSSTDGNILNFRMEKCTP